MSPDDIKAGLKREAERLGFIACGVARAERLDDEAERLDEWLSEDRHAGMAWMANHFEKRVDPRRLVEGARSVVSVAHPYFVPRRTSPGAAQISRYAWGDDYHDVVRERLAALMLWIQDTVGDVAGRAFVDSAPVMDKVWAERSGVGWIGKNSNVLSRDAGSFFFLGELIVDLELPPDHPATDHCGSCTRCIDACPTDAIYRPYVVDSNRCISYWTIEHRGDDLPEALSARFGRWIFGCDICQDVCPWNKFARPTTESRYQPRPGTLTTSASEWAEIDLEAFRERFRKSPVKRARYEGFLRNVEAVARNERAALKDRQRPAE